MTLNFRCPFDSLSLLVAKFWVWGTEAEPLLNLSFSFFPLNRAPC